jgi:hypothetical protein
MSGMDGMNGMDGMDGMGDGADPIPDDNAFGGYMPPEHHHRLLQSADGSTDDQASYDST